MTGDKDGARSVSVFVLKKVSQQWGMVNFLDGIVIKAALNIKQLFL